ncbi:MAG: hypothetical protein ACJ79R_11035 [Anaeromyxobacteraceae bacterium]
MPPFSRGEEPFPASSAWRGDARDLLERAIHRHGGWSRWKALAGVALFPSILRGLVPATKGLGRTFPLPPRIDVWPREAVAVFRHFPAAGERGVFSSGRVTSFDAGGVATAVDDAHRRSFQGFRKYRRWSPLDALYFFGYALTHYLGLPFTLVDGEPLRLRSATAGGRRLRGVEVRLPPELHTHCRTQTFYFDGEGLLRRHDYVAEVLGAWARGAHLWERYVELSGLPVAQRRHVVARLGTRTVPAVALHAEMEVALVKGPAPER